MNKHTILTLFLAIICQSGIAQSKVIQSPKVEAATHNTIFIDRITIGDTATVLDFTVRYKPGNWFSIAKENYIVNSDGGDKLYCKKAIGYHGELGDKWNMPDSGIVHFSLVYPPIHPKTDKIDFIETDNSEGAFKIFGVELVPSKRQSLLPQELEGNWLKTDGSNEWTFGFFDKFAIYKNDFWQYQSVTRQGKTFKMLLKKEKQLVTLTLLPTAEHKLMIAEGQNSMRSYSLSRTNRPYYKIKGDPAFTILPFDRKQAIIQGYMKGYSPKLGYKTQLIYLNNDLTREELPALLTFQPDGRFEAKLPLQYPMIVNLLIEYRWYTIYLEPGDKTTIFLERKNSSRLENFRYMGDHASENKDLEVMKSIGKIDPQKYQKEKTLSPLEFKANRAKDYEVAIDSFQSIRKRYSFSNKALQLKQVQIEINKCSQLLDYLLDAKLNAQNDSTKKVQIDDTYYDFLSGLFKYSEYLPAMEEFSSVINRLEYSPIIDPEYFPGMVLEHKGLENIRLPKEKYSKTNGYYNIPAIIEIFGKMNIPLTLEEQQILKQTPPEKDSVSFFKYLKVKDDFFAKNQTQINIFFTINDFDIQKAILKQKLGVEPGLIFETVMLRALCEQFKKQAFTPLQLAMLKPLFQTPFLQEELVRMNNEKIVLQNEKEMQPKAAVTDGEKVLRKITDKYKDNVLAIDFWSTGCGPCRSGMTKRKDMPDEFLGKKVKFIYITDEESSPLEPYNSFIKDIKGEHLRITRDEWNQLAVKYKINGIPHFMIVNKNGALIENNTVHYWGDDLKKRIDELIRD